MGLQQYDESRQKMAAVQERLNATTREIRDNRAYSASGQKSLLAKAYLAAKQEADTLQTKFVAARNMRRESLQKRLFGVTGNATAIEVRDAQDRADKLDTEAAAQGLLDRARQTGDESLARAAVQRAFNRGWTSVVDSFTQSAGSTTQDLLNELADIPAGSNASTADTLVFRIRPPTELFDASSSLIDFYANDGQEAS